MEGPELTIIVEGQLKSRGRGAQERVYPLYVGVLGDDAKASGAEGGRGCCVEELKRERESVGTWRWGAG